MTGSWTNGAQASDGTGKSLASGVCTMPDRVSVSITIGGILPADRVPELIETANRCGLSLEWDGGPLTEIPSGEPLCLRAHEVVGGDIDDMEDMEFARAAYLMKHHAYRDGRFAPNNDS